MHTIGDVLPIPSMWVAPVTFDTSIKTKKSVSLAIVVSCGVYPYLLPQTSNS